MEENATLGAEEDPSANTTTDAGLADRIVNLKVGDANSHSDDNEAEHTPDDSP